MSRHDRPAKDYGTFEFNSGYAVNRIRQIQQRYRSGKIDEDHAAYELWHEMRLDADDLQREWQMYLAAHPEAKTRAA